MRRFSNLSVGDNIWFVNQSTPEKKSGVDVLVLNVYSIEIDRNKDKGAVSVQTNLGYVICSLAESIVSNRYGGCIYSDRDEVLREVKSLEDKVLGGWLEKYEEFEKDKSLDMVMESVTETILKIEGEFKEMYEKI